MSSIIVDEKINKGAPSVLAENGGYSTVKQVCAILDGFTHIEDPDPVGETAKELRINNSVVHECAEYRKLYPQIME